MWTKMQVRARGYKTFFMLTSTEHKISTAHKNQNAFLGINQFRRVELRFVPWFYVGNTQRLTEGGFMEKPAIEPATPGLHDIGLSTTPL